MGLLSLAGTFQLQLPSLQIAQPWHLSLNALKDSRTGSLLIHRQKKCLAERVCINLIAAQGRCGTRRCNCAVVLQPARSDLSLFKSQAGKGYNLSLLVTSLEVKH